MRTEWKIAFWAGAVLLAALFLWLFSGVLAPFVAALALGYLLNPVAGRLERAGFSRLGASLAMMAVFLLAAAVFLFVVAPALWRQLTSFIIALPDYALRLDELLNHLADYVSKTVSSPLLERLGLRQDVSGDLRNSMRDLLNQGAQWAGAFVRSLWTSGAALISVISLLVLTPVIAFYLLLDWEKMIATVDGLVPPRRRATVRELAREIDAALSGFLRGQSLVCLFLGLWYGVGLSLIGLNYGLLIGLTAGLLSFIPYVGSLTALILSSVFALVQGWPEWRLMLMSLAVVGAGQFLEGNVLSPKLVGESVGLHPVWLIFALLAFGSLFGFGGLLIAVPCAAAFGVLLRYAAARYRASRIYVEPDRAPAIVLASEPEPLPAPAPQPRLGERKG
ncbi:AI-2E family transporter [Methylocella sp.]|uniref:AI-2E family transporter n=1 Tax=Methylocella sp. TaxID=1978226 RepID=UPI003783CC3C